MIVMLDLFAPVVGMALVLVVLLAALLGLWGLRRLMRAAAGIEAAMRGSVSDWHDDEQLETATRLTTGALCGCVAMGVVVALGMALGGGW